MPAQLHEMFQARAMRSLLRRKEFHLPLMNAIENGQIALGELNLDLEQRRLLRKYSSKEVKEKDVKEWAMSDATLDKYKERYKELWREKLDEVVKRMMDKI